jgi:hypothetical protein
VKAALQLGDGRALGYLEVGDRDGPAIFHFHGHGSSRLEVRLIADPHRWRGRFRPASGPAIRFPRLTGHWRDGKAS